MDRSASSITADQVLNPQAKAKPSSGHWQDLEFLIFIPLFIALGLLILIIAHELSIINLN